MPRRIDFHLNLSKNTAFDRIFMMTDLPHDQFAQGPKQPTFSLHTNYFESHVNKNKCVRHKQHTLHSHEQIGNVEYTSDIALNEIFKMYACVCVRERHNNIAARYHVIQFTLWIFLRFYDCVVVAFWSPHVFQKAIDIYIN